MASVKVDVDQELMKTPETVNLERVADWKKAERRPAPKRCFASIDGAGRLVFIGITVGGRNSHLG